MADAILFKPVIFKPGDHPELRDENVCVDAFVYHQARERGMFGGSGVVAYDLAEVVHVAEAVKSAQMFKSLARKAVYTLDEDRRASAGNSPNAYVVVATLHPQARILTAMATGRICVDKTPDVFTLTEGAPPQEQFHPRAETGERLPIPAWLPHSETPRNPVGIQLAPLCDVALVELLGIIDGCIDPAGPSWLTFQNKPVPPRIEQTATLYAIVCCSKIPEAGAHISKAWGACIQRCALKDPSFLRRVREAYPKYATACTSPEILGATVSFQVSLLVEEYRARYFCPTGEFYGKVPVVILDGMKFIYDEYFGGDSFGATDAPVFSIRAEDFLINP